MGRRTSNLIRGLLQLGRGIMAIWATLLVLEEVASGSVGCILKVRAAAFADG